jgi:CRISPR system Cascade subunit CasA
MSRYNLIDEDWIPVRYANGTPGHVGFRRLLTEAQNIADITVDPSIAYAALLRITIALTMRTQLAPLDGSATDWRSWRQTLLQTGPDVTLIDRYLAEHYEAFFLLGDTPFLQIPSLANETISVKGKKTKLKTVRTNKLIIERASGNNAVFWTKFFDDDAPKISHATAALWLVTQWFYAASGQCSARESAGKSLGNAEAGLLRTRAQFFAQGTTLWETVAANCVRAIGDDKRAKTDTCAWEPNAPSVAPSTLSRLTASPRGFLLIGDAEGVTGSYFTWGAKLPDNYLAADPYSATITDLKNETRAYKIRPGWAWWTDVNALLAKGNFDTPKRTFAHPTLLGDLPPIDNLGLTVIAFHAGKEAAKDVGWIRTDLPELLRCREQLDPERYGQLRSFGEVAQQCQHHLSQAIATSGIDGPKSKSIRDAAIHASNSQAERHIWRIVHGHPFADEARTFIAATLAKFIELTANTHDPRLLLSQKTENKRIIRTGIIPADIRLRRNLNGLKASLPVLPAQKEPAHV